MPIRARYYARQVGVTSFSPVIRSPAAWPAPVRVFERGVQEMESEVPEIRMVTLLDGSEVPTRGIRSGDAAALQRFHRRLSDYSIYLRHIRALPNLTDAQARYFTELGHARRIAIVALDPGDLSEIIAVVRAEGSPDDGRAEYAALVADAWQGRGLGTALTRDLIQQARQRGITSLYALVLLENVRMLSLLRDLGLPEQMRFEGGIAEVEMDLMSPAEPHPGASTPE